MPTARPLPGATWSGGRLYVIGGFVSEEPAVALGTVEAYDPTTNIWTEEAPDPAPASHPAIATLPDGQIIVAGGGPKPGIAAVELYTPETNTWQSLTPLPQAVIPTGQALGDTFYVIGGFVGTAGATNAVEAAVVR